VIARILPKELAVEVMRKDEDKHEHVDRILAHFSALKRERDEAIERFQRLRGSIEGQVGDKQQMAVLKNGA